MSYVSVSSRGFTLGVVWSFFFCCVVCLFFFFQAEDGIRDLVRSRGLGDVYKRQDKNGRWIGGFYYKFSSFEGFGGSSILGGRHIQCA